MVIIQSSLPLSQCIFILCAFSNTEISIIDYDFCNNTYPKHKSSILCIVIDYWILHFSINYFIYVMDNMMATINTLITPTISFIVVITTTVASIVKTKRTPLRYNYPSARLLWNDSIIIIPMKSSIKIKNINMLTTPIISTTNFTHEIPLLSSPLL